MVKEIKLRCQGVTAKEGIRSFVYLLQRYIRQHKRRFHPSRTSSHRQRQEVIKQELSMLPTIKHMRRYRSVRLIEIQVSK